jgi:hypothetical protein
MQTRHFCTLFDRGYVFKGVAMLRSLFRFCPGAHVHVLCMDEETRDVLLKLDFPAITCIPLAGFEDADMLEAKKTRNVAEYCWTLTPCLPWHVLEHDPAIDAITYLDADLFFYSPVEPLFAEIGSASIAIIEHRFTQRLRHMEVNGRFCVEWVGFRRDAQGLACLKRWRAQCLEWCYARLENGRMGDQKYLDVWPLEYPSVHVLQHEGAGLAPWNFDRYHFGRLTDDSFTVNGVPLVFYHFHQFQLLEGGGFDRLSESYIAERREPDDVYSAYESALQNAVGQVQRLVPDFRYGIKSAAHVTSRRLVQRFVPRPIKEALRRVMTRMAGKV